MALNENRFFKPEQMTTQAAFDGLPAQVVTLTNRFGMSISIMDIGATWLSCIVPVNGYRRDVLLGSADMKAHQQQTAYFGATVGRFANRIAGAKFTIAGTEYRLVANEGNNTLHGGKQNFSHRRWTIVAQSTQSVTLSLLSADGEQGFPGTVEASVTYTLTDDNEVHINYQAISDKTTALSLTNHAYFNLAGEHTQRTALEHDLVIHASHYLKNGAGNIPTGEIVDVTGTGFDFRQLKRIGIDFMRDECQKAANGYDHAFILDKQKIADKASIATVIAPEGELKMDVFTTMPSIQFYTGNFLTQSKGKTRRYGNYSGLALETQYFPDGPNHPEWGENQGILAANTPWHSQTIYKFYQ